MFMLPCLILWNIWKARNLFKFTEVPMTVNSILLSVKLDVSQMHKASDMVLSTEKVDPELLKWFDINPHVEKASTLIIVRWIAPPYNWVKLNCDGASKGNPGHSAAGGLIRNCDGNLICAYTTYYGVHTSIWAEAKAVLDGLLIVQSKSLTHVWIEVDSVLVAQMIQGKCAVPWNVQYLLRQIHALLPLHFFLS